MKYAKKLLDNDIVQVDPLPTESELEAYYKNLYYQQSDGSKSSYDVTYTDDEIAHKILEAQLPLHAINHQFSGKTNGKTLLELGCGEGFFLNEAHKQHYQVQGIDFSQFGITKWHPHLLEYCQFGNIYHYLKSFINEQQKFDVLVLRNVLEHVIAPGALLTQLKQILKPNGVVLLTVPNDYSELQKRALSLNHIDTEFWFSPPDHLHYFNANNLGPFIEQFGFDVVDMYSSFPVDFYLFHPGSNYILNKSNGKAAHFARVNLDLLMADHGNAAREGWQPQNLENVLNVYRAMIRCGMGRVISVLLKAS